ncbi:hypothetical protein GGH95_004631, partial [Coemansia sp. RSA 1836]
PVSCGRGHCRHASRAPAAAAVPPRRAAAGGWLGRHADVDAAQRRHSRSGRHVEEPRRGQYTHSGREDALWLLHQQRAEDGRRRNGRDLRSERGALPPPRAQVCHVLRRPGRLGAARPLPAHGGNQHKGQGLPVPERLPALLRHHALGRDGAGRSRHAQRGAGLLGARPGRRRCAAGFCGGFASPSHHGQAV